MNEELEGSHQKSLVQFSLTIVFAVTVLLIGGLIADRQRASLAVLCGTTFFALFGGFVILVLSGHLTRLHATKEREKTVRERDRIRLHLYTAPQIGVVEERGEMVTPITARTTFVPAVPAGSEGVKIAAYNFIYTLFEHGEQGRPDPKRVLDEETRSPNRIQLRKPREEVLDYLMGLGMVWEDENKVLFYNRKDFSTLIEAKLAIKRGRRGEG